MEGGGVLLLKGAGPMVLSQEQQYGYLICRPLYRTHQGREDKPKENQSRSCCCNINGMWEDPETQEWLVRLRSIKSDRHWGGITSWPERHTTREWLRKIKYSHQFRSLNGLNLTLEIIFLQKSSPRHHQFHKKILCFAHRIHFNILLLFPRAPSFLLVKSKYWLVCTNYLNLPKIKLQSAYLHSCPSIMRKQSLHPLSPQHIKHCVISRTAALCP